MLRSKIYAQLSNLINAERWRDRVLRIVILGGGYGGLRVAHRLLERDLPDNTSITLIDRSSFHYSKTEFHSVAAGTKPIAEVRTAFPEHDSLKVKDGEVAGISLERKMVELLEDEPIPYDSLVIALGCEDNFRDIEGAEDNTLSIQSAVKTLQTLVKLTRIKPYSSVGIIGAGLTGVEMAAEVRESRPDLNITVYQHSDKILGGFSRHLQNYVLDWFASHDIEVSFNSQVQKIEHGGLYNRDKELPCEAILWGAGVRPNKIVRALDVEKADNGRVILDNFHQIPNYPGVFVNGDCANLPHPPSAQLAEQQGDQIAQVLSAYLQGETPEPLDEIQLRGTLGSLGARDGFGVAMGLDITGIIARVMKSAVLGLSHLSLG